MSRFLTVIVSIGSAILMLLHAISPGFDPNHYGDLLLCCVSSYTQSTQSKEVEVLLDKIGGFAKGVCHPSDDFEQIKEANIEWVRVDLSALPVDLNGNITVDAPIYKWRKSSLQKYVDAGFKIMAITPYPKDYIELGIDPRTAEGKEKVKQIAEIYATDLQGIVSAFQITNEMGVENFTSPLTLSEAAEFIGIQLKAMMNLKGNIVTGFNCASTTMSLLLKEMKPYFSYCDYIGVDLYLGSFEDVFTNVWFYESFLRAIWNYTGKPVMMNEFGYIGGGEAKSNAERTAILQSYGYNSESEAIADASAFIEKLPEGFRKYLRGMNLASDAEIADRVFNSELSAHFYKELKNYYKLDGIEHTPDGQAKFFKEVIRQVKDLDFLCGAFAYSYCDNSSCYICGQNDCPVETAWGLVDLNGNPKPAYYALQSAFASIDR